MIIDSSPLCTGLNPVELQTELDDIKLLRLARLLPPTRLILLCANLLDDIQFLDNLEQQYRGYKTSDYAFMILYEWKKSVKNTRKTPTAGCLKVVLDEDPQLNKHHLCQVYVP